MSITTNSREGVLTIQLDDARLLEEGRIQQVEKDLVEAIDASEDTRIVLDFSKVQFMSSSMLGKLVAIHKKVKSYKAKMKLASVSPEILEVFKITRLDKLFDIAPDVEAARKAFLKKGLFG
ncbi:Anti-sigma-B factor antagonist [Planctomycetes bacterium MalM25]|nr:Anti-sigma-B factor antagonist [Planctomycetes bacterium MalM25]